MVLVYGYGVPIFFDRNRSSYEVRSDYRFAVPKLTPSEILGQTVAAAVTRAVGVDVAGAAASTTSKLAAAAPEEDQQLFADAQAVLEALSLQFVDHAGHEATIQTCQQALLTSRQITGVYRSPYQQDAVRLTLSPVRLCLIKNALYLIAVPDGANHPRTYRIARFESLAILDQPAVTVEEFDLQAYLGNAWAVYRGDKTYAVAIRFTPAAAKIVTETTWHATQRAEHHEGGSVTLHYTVDGLSEILEWLLTWTGQAEVLAPPQLRSMLVQRLEAGLKMNALLANRCEMPATSNQTGA